MTPASTVFPDKFASIEELRKTYIRTPRDEMFRLHLDRLLKRGTDGCSLPEPVRFTATGETRGIALVEGPSGGKTSLVHHVLSKHPALQTDDPMRMLWIGVRVPRPATLKSLGLEVLRQSGYPHASASRKEWDIWCLVRDRLRTLGTVVLWIDEAHDLFRAGKAYQIEDILKMLKSIMQGDGAVIVVLTGVDTLWKIASYDDQVKRRYSKVTLPPVSSSKDEKALLGVIHHFSRQVGLEVDLSHDIVERLVHASRNRFGRCIENIVAALETAVLQGANGLDIQHFAEAWAMQEGCDRGKNVFLSPQWAQIDMSAPEANSRGLA